MARRWQERLCRRAIHIRRGCAGSRPNRYPGAEAASDGRWRTDYSLWLRPCSAPAEGSQACSAAPGNRCGPVPTSSSSLFEMGHVGA